MRMKISSALPLIFAALGQMFIVMCGDVDMGNGYSIGLVNVIVGIWLTGNPLVGFLGLVIFVGLYMALAALIKIRQIPAIVVTMGAQFVWYGLALIICPTPGGKCRNGFLIFSELRHRSFHFQLSLPWSPDWHAGIFFTDADMVLFLGAQETMSRHWNVPDGATFLQKWLRMELQVSL